MSSAFASASSSALLPFEQLLEVLSTDERIAVLTPNRRLAVYLKDQFDTTQRHAGHKAWATPDILPFPTFLERTYRTLTLRDETRMYAQLLNSAQSQLLWEQVVRASDVASHLLSLTQTAKQAAAAWSVAHAWDLLPAMWRSPLNEDAEVFLKWAKRFEQLCREQHVIDAAVLPTVVATYLREAIADKNKDDWTEILPSQIFTTGFDIVTPQLQNFLDACAARGVSVSAATSLPAHARVDAQCRRIEFATEDAELRGCAMWARQRLQENPEQRIAIVVPDLRSKRGKIIRALTDALQPGLRAASSMPTSGVSSGFNLSLGLPLNEYALVHDALSMIDFSQNRPNPFLQFGALLRSPFIAGASSEIGPRARLDAALREIVGPDISLFALQRKLKLANEPQLMRAVSECPTLLARIDRVANIDSPGLTATSARQPRPAPRKFSPRDWSRHFGQVLLAWGFPGEETLDSTDYQVVEKFRDALAALAILDAVQPHMRVDEALNHLCRIVADTVFQPEAAHNTKAPIQVLGILESAGQSFDALWVAGLSEEAWPLVARPNPFIPAGLQRAAGVTEASAATSLALDQRITSVWRECAPEVVFSHAETSDGNKGAEQKRAASALTRDIPPTEHALLIANDISTDYAQALFSSRQSEPIPDTPLAALPLPTKVGGGATVLRDQAACPFRAFARHRLGARTLGSPESGLDAAERGTLLHRVLSLLWTRLQTHAQLMAMDEIATKNLVDASIERAISEAHAKGLDSLAGRFADIEHTRLSRLVTDWLTYERERTPFEVVACEEARDVSLAGLSMRLRLDRLDRLEDGTHALIDYKTGAAKVASWLGERPDEPQLPLYFQTATQTISALAFARVKRGVRGKVFGFEGVSATENLLPDVGPIETKIGMEKAGYISWDVLTAEWEGALDALAKNFINGDALVDPKNGSLTCAQCDLQSVCRISELNGSQVADKDSDDGEGSVSPGKAFDE